jgi:hypothetical protein
MVDTPARLLACLRCGFGETAARFSLMSAGGALARAVPAGKPRMRPSRPFPHNPNRDRLVGRSMRGLRCDGGSSYRGLVQITANEGEPDPVAINCPWARLSTQALFDDQTCWEEADAYFIATTWDSRVRNCCGLWFIARVRANGVGLDHGMGNVPTSAGPNPRKQCDVPPYRASDGAGRCNPATI